MREQWKVNERHASYMTALQGFQQVTDHSPVLRARLQFTPTELRPVIGRGQGSREGCASVAVSIALLGHTLECCVPIGAATMDT